MAIKSVTVQKTVAMTKAHAVGMVRKAVGCCMDAIEIADTGASWKFTFFGDGLASNGTVRTVDVAPGVTLETAEKLGIPAASQQELSEKANALAWAVDDARWRDGEL